MIATAWSRGSSPFKLDDTAGVGDLYKVYSADKINSLIVAASYGIKYSVNLIDDLLGMSEVQVLDLAVVNEDRWVYRYDGVIWEMFFALDADNDSIYARKDGTSFTGKVYVQPSHVAGAGLNFPNGAMPQSAHEMGDLYNSINQLYFHSGLGTGKIWHSANDGADSGLDADLLDGNHASAFALTSHNHNTVYLGITAKAADSDKLDGVNSTSFVRSDATDSISGAITHTGNYYRFNDNIELYFGTSTSQSYIYSNGVSTYWKLTSGNLYVYDNSTLRFAFNRTTGDLSAHNFLVTSDRRLKKKIKSFKKGVDGLISRSFIYKDVKNGKTNFGFIAQEMLKTHPELVSGTGKKDEKGNIDYYSINEVGLIPFVVNDLQIVKEKVKEIPELKREIIELKKKLKKYGIK